MVQELITKYKVSYFREDVITHETKLNSLIFDSIEEADQWLSMTGLDAQPQAVKGKMVTKFQPTSCMGLGVWGRETKIWEEIP